MASHLRIKICGVTSEDDGCQAALLGADAIGLNFYPRSPRAIDTARARAILRELPPFIEAVGIFVNQSWQQIVQQLHGLDRIRTVQCHGAEPEVQAAPPLSWIAAFPIGSPSALEDVNRYLERCRRLGSLPAAILVDAHVAGEYGGTGQTAPWELLADFRPGVPLILAGGLTPENVAEAVRIVRPYAVDVASGVERSPGRKDPDRMRRFIERAREAAAQHGTGE